MLNKLPPGLIYAVAALPLMVAGALIPDLVHLTQAERVVVLCLCFVAELMLVGLGAAKELGNEKNRSKQGHGKRMIAIYGMLLCGVGFIVSGGIYLWPEKSAIAVATGRKPAPPPMGSLRLGDTTLNITLNKNREHFAGNIEVQFFNDSDKLIYYKAFTAGRINNVSFDRNKIEFDGYIAAHGEQFLISKRLFNIPTAPLLNAPNQYITGIYEYELSHGYADTKDLARKTFRGLRIIVWNAPPYEPHGTILKIPQKVEIYQQSEE